MTKKLFYGICLLIGTACSAPKAPTGIDLEVTVEGLEDGQIYLCEIQNVHYGTAKVIDTLTVEKGKATYVNDSLRSGLYAFAYQLNGNYGMPRVESDFFLQPGENRFHYTVTDGEQKTEAIKPLSMQLKYEVLQSHLKKIDEPTDSINSLFYAARAKGDRDEMARIKESTADYYEKAEKEKADYINTTMEENRDNTFGLYLYYAHYFQNRMISSLEEIENVRTKIKSFGENAQKSEFAYQMELALNNFAKCAIGSQAPEIEGLTPKDKPIKLSDFRGKWVIVDFWSSSCSWCRKENVYLKPAYKNFKKKGLVILGVSSDLRKEDWIKALKEDKTDWDQLLMLRKEIGRVNKAYCIVGIPHIILVNPEGVIVEKDLRGEGIEKALNKHIQKEKK